MIQVLVFAAGSVAIVWVSWSSLREPRGHGFFRFFAFEAILALTALNLPFWFHDPFSLQQIVSWVLLSAALVLVVHGFWLLRVVGKPTDSIEQTTKLVAVGAYRYIRHPLYSSLLWLTWGAFLKHPSPLGGILGLMASVFLFVTARVEEAENLHKFDSAYAEYMKRTRMFIPFLF